MYAVGDTAYVYVNGELENTVALDHEIVSIEQKHEAFLRGSETAIHASFKSTYRKIKYKGKLRKVVITSYIKTGDGSTMDKLVTEITKPIAVPVT